MMVGLTLLLYMAINLRMLLFECLAFYSQRLMWLGKGLSSWMSTSV